MPDTQRQGTKDKAPVVPIPWLSNLAESVEAQGLMHEEA